MYKRQVDAFGSDGQSLRLGGAAVVVEQAAADQFQPTLETAEHAVTVVHLAGLLQVEVAVNALDLSLIHI